MKVWACVYIYAGVIDEQRVFKTREKAEKWFRGKTDKFGGKEACDVGDYHVSSKVLYFFDSMNLGKTEVKCELVEEEE
jgi:hypothetical protein